MVTLSAANSFAGGTLVTGGTLQVATPAALPDGSDLSIGANVLSAFAAPIVPAATAAAASVNAPVHASVDVAPAAPSNRTLSVHDKAFQAAPADARWRAAARLKVWANWPPFDNRQDRTISPLAARDAVVADYWPGT
jgi:autotransporter-associated beta strand protein